MAFKVTTGRPLFEPDFINHLSIGGSERLQFVYRPVTPFQKLVQRGGLDISFVRAIAIAEIPARNQEDRQDDQHAERVELPRPTGIRPEDDIFYSDQNRFHMSYQTISPSRISIVREAVVAASGLCVIMTIVCPNSRLSFRSMSSTIVEFSVSRFPVGSSANMIEGRLIMARAIATRCCSPPDNSRGLCRILFSSLNNCKISRRVLSSISCLPLR